MILCITSSDCVIQCHIEPVPGQGQRSEGDRYRALAYVTTVTSPWLPNDHTCTTYTVPVTDVVTTGSINNLRQLRSPVSAIA
jgi:hypothetical protein